MINARHYCLKHGGRVGDVIGVTVYTGDSGVMYEEWVIAPRGVLRRFLLPPDTIAA